METMVATVLIVVIFMISSMLLNTIFTSSIIGNTNPVQERMLELEYAYKKGMVTVPYVEEWNTWTIELKKGDINGVECIVFGAVESRTLKELTSYLMPNE